MNLQADAIKMEFDIVEHEYEHFLADAKAFMATKLRSTEVSYTRLDEEDRALFNEAMARELSQHLGQEAIRRCLWQQEHAEAWDSGRIMKARWVLS